MGRRNVYLSAELEAEVAAQLPNVSLSEVLQSALVDLIRLRCEHHALRCRTCGVDVDGPALEDAAVAAVVGKVVRAFYGGDYLVSSKDAAGLVHHLASRGGRQVGPPPDWSMTNRARRALAPTSWAALHLADERAAAVAAAERRRVVTALPLEVDARRRHPTARNTPKTATPAAPTPQERTA